MWDSKLFKAGVGILLLFLIIYVGSKISFIFYPIVVAFEVLFISFLIAGILFYFTYPLCDWLTAHKFPRSLAIIVVFIIIGVLFVLLGFAIGPILADEITKLAINLPGQIYSLQDLAEKWSSNPLLARLFDAQFVDLENLSSRIVSMASSTLFGVLNSISSLVNFMASIFLTVIMIPFLLYYMLKEKGSKSITLLVDRIVPRNYSGDVKSALAEINRMLGAYFQGLGFVCFLVGLLAYIGFLIIGLEFALILSVFIMLTNVIPFIGPFIGAIPAAFIGLLESPLMMLQVVIVVIIVQQLESLVISPQVMGRKMALSPLVIILIVLVAGRLGGFLGIILAVPIFTVIKIVANHVYAYLRKEDAELN